MDKHQGYIIERVIDDQRQDICVHGQLEVSGLDVCLRPPLQLRQVEVAGITPICCDIPYGIKDRERIRVHLICTVQDACGRTAKGLAQIEAEVYSTRCIGSIRRGADLCVKHACFVCGCLFDINAIVTVHTVVSRCEMIRQPVCKATCPRLPLYPQPCKAKYGCSSY